MSTTLGDTLRITRKARKLTLKDIQTATGVSNAYLSQLETGKIDKPGAEVLATIATAYGIPRQTLFYIVGYILPDDEAPIFPNVPQFIIQAAEVLTDDDWLALQGTVEWMTALRRAALAPASAGQGRDGGEE
jgi:transcriptional regulator with XRE-family HTH domain